MFRFAFAVTILAHSAPAELRPTRWWADGQDDDEDDRRGPNGRGQDDDDDDRRGPNGRGKDDDDDDRRRGRHFDDDDEQSGFAGRISFDRDEEGSGRDGRRRRRGRPLALCYGMRRARDQKPPKLARGSYGRGVVSAAPSRGRTGPRREANRGTRHAWTWLCAGRCWDSSP